MLSHNDGLNIANLKKTLVSTSTAFPLGTPLSEPSIADGSVRGGEKETAFETGRPDAFPGAYSGLCLGRAHQAHQGETTETGGGLRQAHAIEKVENPSSRLLNVDSSYY